MGNGENSGECPLIQATAEEGLTGEREGVFGKEDRALGGCGITRSWGAEVKKVGVGPGGGSRPVQQGGDHFHWTQPQSGWWSFHLSCMTGW